MLDCGILVWRRNFCYPVPKGLFLIHVESDLHLLYFGLRNCLLILCALVQGNVDDSVSSIAETYLKDVDWNI